MLEHLCRHERSASPGLVATRKLYAGRFERTSDERFLVFGMGGAPLSALWTIAEWSLARCARWKGSHPSSFRAALICLPVIIR